VGVCKALRVSVCTSVCVHAFMGDVIKSRQAIYKYSSSVGDIQYSRLHTVIIHIVALCTNLVHNG